jgi:16S rRNA (uracil1498-N3)-methyltransferase
MKPFPSGFPRSAATSPRLRRPWRGLPASGSGGIVPNMSERFYTNWPLGKGPVTLDGPEARHLSQVCRLRPGDAVCLFNGDGYEYPARIVAVERRLVELEVLERAGPARELPYRVDIAAPLPRGDRAQFLVEKLTELGVARYVPLETQRSVVHPREGKLDKLQRYAIEASKQSGRNVLMEIHPPVPWQTYCRGAQLPAHRFLGHPGGALETSALEPGRDTAWAVGPEGGFTDEEVGIALEAGWQTVNLGARILRVETAAIAGAVLCAMGSAMKGSSAASGG